MNPKEFEIKNQQGFSALDIILAIVAICAIGVAGFFAIRNHTPTSAAKISKPSATSTPTPSPTADPYAGWKTYTSPLQSGLTFKYPADWSFTPSSVVTNRYGGQENDVTLFSVKPQTTPGAGAPIATNEYMCVSFDEYGGQWFTSSEKFPQLLASESFQASGSDISLNTYKGDSPMQAEMQLITNPPDSHGTQYITTKNGFYVSVTADFNCVQSGFPSTANLNEDFNSRPETATAKLIMKSLKL